MEGITGFIISITGFLISLGIIISLCTVIANWGKAVGMRWGQVLLFGIALSPIVAALIVLVYSASKKIRLAFSK